MRAVVSCPMLGGDWPTSHLHAAELTASSSAHVPLHARGHPFFWMLKPSRSHLLLHPPPSFLCPLSNLLLCISFHPMSEQGGSGESKPWLSAPISSSLIASLKPPLFYGDLLPTDLPLLRFPAFWGVVEKQSRH